MATARLQRVEPAPPDCPVADPVDRRQEWVEGACLTGLIVLGGLLFLILLLIVVQLLYFGLTLQNEMFVLPSSGTS
ncbi:MAG: hypothetical protein HYV75_07300 [Opitutae bacterium]|nr:hypothetical protein [Opitutae bacterium]